MAPTHWEQVNNGHWVSIEHTHIHTAKRQSYRSEHLVEIESKQSADPVVILIGIKLHSFDECRSLSLNQTNTQ